MKVNRVTFTGADDQTDSGRMLEISRLYPEVEWGILFSKSNVGSPRYPTRDWVVDLVARIGAGNVVPRLSAHLCGRYVRDLVQGINFTWDQEFAGISGLFQRVQLNFHAQWHTAHEKFLTMVALHSTKHQFIYQVDGVNDVQVKQWCSRVGVPLFDVSGGAGVVPAEWPESWPELYCGYAGGLSPENTTMELIRIFRVAEGWIWIDMESRVRNDRNEFDLEMCLSVLKLVYGERK